MILPNLTHFGHDGSCYLNNYRRTKHRIMIRGDVKIHWQSLQTFAKVCWQQGGTENPLGFAKVGNSNQPLI